MKIPHSALMQTEKPGRYVGGEINAVKKQLPCPVRFGFCFPDVYEVGMSHLGLQILYFFLNRRDDVYCERFFAPWSDMEARMRERAIPPVSLETGTPALEFDFIGFTLQYELCYTNVINMLNLAGIPFYSKERNETFPLICGGGPCAYNPMPLAPFFDFFYIGEAEEMLDAVVDIYKEGKRIGATKSDILKQLSAVDGVFVPEFFDKENGRVCRVYTENLDGAFFPERFVVPLIEAVHDRVGLELFRGCSRGCRFCHAGFTSRPVRERSVKELSCLAQMLTDNTGHGEISLVSLSTGDYSRFGELAETLTSQFEGRNINLSLPSLRADKLTRDTARYGRAGLTIAPEAGSARLRNVINKGLSEEEILKSASEAFSAGNSRVKLYFMAGLPTETEDDLREIPRLCEAVLEEFYKVPKDVRARNINISVSGACFVPKPHTPFQWQGQDSHETFARKHRLVKSLITKRQIRYSYHDGKSAIIEGALARGDERISTVIIKAWERGARFDGWTDCFDYAKWASAFADCGILPDEYTRPRDISETLPWSFIDTGVSRGYLLKERERAFLGAVTPPCVLGCVSCGICGGKGAGK